MSHLGKKYPSVKCEVQCIPFTTYRIVNDSVYLNGFDLAVDMITIKLLLWFHRTVIMSTLAGILRKSDESPREQLVILES